MSLLLLRADAGGAIGSGHVMRLMALAEAWIAGGGSCLMASSALPEPLAERLRGVAGLATAPIGAPAWSGADAAAVAALARQYGARAIAIDSHLADAAYLAALNLAGLPLLFVDDLAALSQYPCTLLLNQNLTAEWALYAGKIEPQRLLLGPAYAMLRREFSEMRARVRSIGVGAHRLLVTFGGVDPKNASAVAIDALRRLPEIEAELVIGAANTRADALAAAAAPVANVNLVYDARDMAARIAAADMVLSASGTTIWEAAALGAPTLLVAATASEEQAAQRVTHDGGVYLGRIEDLRAENLAAAIQGFAHDLAARARSSVIGRALVDGRGAERVAAAINEVL